MDLRAWGRITLPQLRPLKIVLTRNHHLPRLLVSLTTAVTSDKFSIKSLWILSMRTLCTVIRYLLFNFPVLSAVVGVSTNFIFLSILSVFSYIQLMLAVLQKPVQVSNCSVLFCECIHIYSICAASSFNSRSALLLFFSSPEKWTVNREWVKRQ